MVHLDGIDMYSEGSVVALVNDSGVPFVERAEHLILRAALMEPEAVLLGGSALTGRPGKTYQRVLAVQLFSRAHGIRAARIATVTPDRGLSLQSAPGEKPRPMRQCGRKRSW